MIGKLNSFQKSWLWKLIPVAVAVPFVYGALTQNQLGRGHQIDYLVSFNDPNQGILYNQFQQQYQEIYNRRLQELGPEAFEAEMTPEREQQLRRTVLNNLIDERALQLYADKVGIKISNEDIIQVVREDKNFRDQSGKFNEDIFKRFLAHFGLSIEQYFDLVRNDLRRNLIASYLEKAAIVVPREVEFNSRVALPTAQIQVAKVEAKDFVSTITPTEEQLREYYQKNRAQFEVPAEATYSYVLYSRADLEKLAPAPTEEEIKKFYEDNKAHLYETTQYEIGDIILKDLASANEVVAALNNGEDFTKVSNEFNTDQLLKDSGGVLGEFSLAEVPIKEFETILPLMQEGRSSNPIRVADDGSFHVLYLFKKNHRSTSLEEAKASIVKTLTESKKKDFLANFQRKVLEAEEQGTTLADLAKEYKLKVETTKSFTLKQVPQPLTEAFVKLAFEGNVPVKKIQSPQALGDKEIVYQVDNLRETSYKPFDTVKDEVIASTKLQIAQNQQTERLNRLARRLNEANPPYTEAQRAKLLEENKLDLSGLRSLSIYEPGEDNLPFYRTVFTSSFAGNAVDFISVPVDEKRITYFVAVHGFDIDSADKELLKAFQQGNPRQLVDDFYFNALRTVRQELGVKINWTQFNQSSEN